MNLLENAIKLRGRISSDPVVSEVATIVNGSHTLLELSVEDSGLNRQNGAWGIRMVELTIVCPGPDFAGVTPDMRKGDYIQVVGELDVLSSVEPIVVKGNLLPAVKALLVIRALRVRGLECAASDAGQGENG